MDRPTFGHTRSLIETLFPEKLDEHGRPYLAHCMRVLDFLPPDATDDERHAALLQNVLTDLPITAQDLRELCYSERTIWLVERLTRSKDVAYFDYIRSIKATGDPGLIAIKLADNAADSDQGRMALLAPEDRARLVERYAKARAILTDG